LLIVVDDEGLWSIEPASIDAHAVADPLDPLTPLHRVDALSRGTQVAGVEEAVRWRTIGAARVAAQQLGIAVAATDLAVAYAKERQQFDRPIGSFQAVKHLLADMLVRAEVARAVVYAAGVTLDDPEIGDVSRAVATAKLMAGEAAVRNGKTCVQVFGGMGFTWEVDAHLYLKRAWMLDTVFGSSDDHALAIAGGL
jgi:alkylation response protein AidB-like acyl-CoA dehydrogenase